MALGTALGIGALAGGALGALGDDPVTTTISQMDPASRKYIEDILKRAGNLYFRPFEGDFTATGDEDELAGIQRQLDFATSPGLDIRSQLVSENLLRGAREIGSLENLDPEKNRALGLSTQVLNQQVQDFFDNALLQSRGEANRLGAFGGTRQALLEAAKAGEAGKALASGQAQLLQNERNLIPLAGQLFNQGIGAGLAPGRTQQALGADLRALEQLQLNNELQKFLFPQQQLESAAGIGASLLPMTTTQKSTTDVDSTTKFLQGALGGASLGASAYSLFNPSNFGGGMGASQPTAAPQSTVVPPVTQPRRPNLPLFQTPYA